MRLTFVLCVATAQSLTLPSMQQRLTLPALRKLPALEQPARLSISIARLRGGQSEMSIFSSNLFPFVGIFTSNALYFSSIPAVVERVKEGSLGPLNPIPTTCIVLSTLAWLMYAFSVPNPWVVTSNLPGACAAMAAMTMMLPLMRGSKQLLFVQSTLVGGTLMNLVLWSYLIFSGMTAAARSHILGLYASVFFIILSASPLSTIKDVVLSKDSASIYAPMTVAQCVNCALWSTCTPVRFQPK